MNICRKLHPLLFSTWKWRRKRTWSAESRWATHPRCHMCHNHISGRLRFNQFHSWGGQWWARTSPRSPLPRRHKAGQAPNEQQEAELTSSLHFSYNISEALKYRKAQEPTTCSLYNRKHLLLWIITNRRLLKELILQQDHLNIYILQGLWAARSVYCQGCSDHARWRACMQHTAVLHLSQQRLSFGKQDATVQALPKLPLTFTCK